MKISIITATYNSAETLPQTLESILSQTYDDYEVIVVDGLSTDDTMKIVRHYAGRFSGKLRFVSEKDRGLYDAMNKGLQMAEGDVVGILNSDDFYTSDTILRQVADAMQTTDVDAVYGDVHYVSQNNTQKILRHYSSRFFRPWMMRLGFMPAHPSFYCKRRLYLRHGLFDLSYKVAADFEQLLRLIFIHRISTRYLPLDFVTMRVGGASSSGWHSHKRIMADHLRALRENKVYSNIGLLAIRYLYKIGEVITTRSLVAVKTLTARTSRPTHVGIE